MAKAAKSTRKFAASGRLKKTIQSRKKHQQVLKKAAGRRGAKGKGKRSGDAGENHDDDEEEEGKG
jgi:nucleolar complex protein 2